MHICSHQKSMSVTGLDADESSCASSPHDTVKAPGGLKLCCTILINKQVSKRGQITVKPSKDGYCWNNPRRQESRRALLLPELFFLYAVQGSVSGLTQVHPAWWLGSCWEPPRSCNYYCCCPDYAWNVGGKQSDLKAMWMFAVENCIDLLMRFFLFGSAPLLNPHTWLGWVMNEL